MINSRTICRLNQSVYPSLTCCYNRARCLPGLIVSLSNPIQNPNSLKRRLIDSSNVKKMEALSWCGSRNHQKMLARDANWTAEKSPYDTLQNMQQDQQIADTESETDSYKPVFTASEEDESDSEVHQMDIVCEDGIRFDAKLFLRESLMIREAYNSRYFKFVEVESNSDIIKKVELFCVERAKIQNNDETLLQQQNKLNDFNANFCQANRKHALDLMIAAFNLQMRSLVDLMMEDVIDIFLKMTEDEAYKIFYVNLKDEFSHSEFVRMNKRVTFNNWAFEAL